MSIVDSDGNKHGPISTKSDETRITHYGSFTLHGNGTGTGTGTGNDGFI